jgi:hypothetical protein
VDSKTLDILKPVRIEQALQGTVSGVNVTTTSGSPELHWIFVLEVSQLMEMLHPCYHRWLYWGAWIIESE